MKPSVRGVVGTSGAVAATVGAVLTAAHSALWIILVAAGVATTYVRCRRATKALRLAERDLEQAVNRRLAHMQGRCDDQ